jgi:hypothetical protein
VNTTWVERGTTCDGAGVVAGCKRGTQERPALGDRGPNLSKTSGLIIPSMQGTRITTVPRGSPDGDVDIAAAVGAIGEGASEVMRTGERGRAGETKVIGVKRQTAGHPPKNI